MRDESSETPDFGILDLVEEEDGKSKRFTYVALLLNALFWSWAFNIPLMFMGSGKESAPLAAMIIGAKLFIPVWIISIVSYFLLERLLKLKKFNLYFLPMICLAFPVVWVSST